MGMYTELIFGASLKKETPTHVINTLQNMVDSQLLRYSDDALPKEIVEFKDLFQCCSTSFGVMTPHSKLQYHIAIDTWELSVRCSVKYTNKIDEFLAWIKPWISDGSGFPGFYAIVTYEEAEKPRIYYLKEKHESESH